MRFMRKCSPSHSELFDFGALTNSASLPLSRVATVGIAWSWGEGIVFVRRWGFRLPLKTLIRFMSVLSTQVNESSLTEVIVIKASLRSVFLFCFYDSQLVHFLAAPACEDEGEERRGPREWGRVEGRVLWPFHITRVARRPRKRRRLLAPARYAHAFGPLSSSLLRRTEMAQLEINNSSIH